MDPRDPKRKRPARKSGKNKVKAPKAKTANKNKRTMEPGALQRSKSFVRLLGYLVGLNAQDAQSLVAASRTVLPFVLAYGLLVRLGEWFFGQYL